MKEDNRGCNLPNGFFLVAAYLWHYDICLSMRIAGQDNALFIGSCGALLLVAFVWLLLNVAYYNVDTGT